MIAVKAGLPTKLFRLGEGECPIRRNQSGPTWRSIITSATTTSHTALYGEGTMGKFTSRLPLIVVLSVAAGFAAPQVAQVREHGDNLLIPRVQQEKGMNLSSRGMSMSKVEKTWGAPQRKLSPRGGDPGKHPQIN